MRLALLLCCALLTAACDEAVTGPTVPLDTEFTLAPGETAAVDDAAIRVRFNRVTGDNRCPADAVCVLGGSADVSITVSGAGAPRDYVLSTGDLAPVQHAAYTITLRQVSPYPFSARTIEPDDYRITLTVTRT